MPTTVNRNYPYPALTDAPNIPLALENLANAIDNDINTVAASVPQGMASELETRATLLEGRLSTLENRQIKTTNKTYKISERDRYLDSNGVFDIDFSYLSDLTQIEYAGLTQIETTDSNTGIWDGYWSNFIHLVIKEKHVIIHCRKMCTVSCFIVYT